MRSTLIKQHDDCLDVITVECDIDRVKIVSAYYEGRPDIEKLDIINSSSMLRCDFDKSAFVVFLTNTLAVLEVEE